MSLILRNMQNECLKLLNRKKYMVFLIIEIVICILVLLIQNAVNHAMDDMMDFRLANMSLAMLTFFIVFYIPLIVFMASCDLFTTEMQDNSIKAILMRPMSRLKVFLSKVLAITVFAVAYLVCLFLITNIMEAATSGGIRNFWGSFGAYLLDIIPLFVLVLMAVLINQLTKSSTLAMFLCILIYVLLNIAGILVPQLSGILFTGYAQWHNLWLGSTLPVGAMVSKIGLLLGYTLVFGCGGYYLFERKDF